MANFSIWQPDAATPIVIDYPHSGVQVPQSMQAALLPHAVLANTDWFLPQLWQPLLAAHTSLVNHLSRYVVDPNRALTDEARDYRRALVYQQNTFDHPLYATPLPAAVRQARIQQYYLPYRQALAALIAAKKRQFGYVYLLDLHSFAQYPHSTTAPSDIVIGNDFDHTLPQALRVALSQRLTEAGFSVSANRPFRGGDIVRAFGAQPHVRTVQLELRYQAYIAKRAFGEAVVAGFDPVVFEAAQQRLAVVAAWLADLPAF